MKHFLYFFLLLLVQDATKAQTAEHLALFPWLQGHWKGQMENASIEEKWKKTGPQALEGTGLVMVNNDTVVKEVLRIEKIAGHWCYIASINGKPPVLFSLAEEKENEWVFENKEHDFPQKVVYSRGSNNELIAWIEGVSGGNPSKETYVMHKVP